jgi:hypothetical protein
MAKTLDKSTIVSLGIVKPGHVSQSVDAFTGTDAYDITISGSLVVTGSQTTTQNINVSGTINSLNTAGILDLSNGFDGTSDVFLGSDNGTYNAGWIYLVSGSSNGNYAQIGTGATGAGGLGLTINDRKGETTSWNAWNQLFIGDNSNNYLVNQTNDAFVAVNAHYVNFISGTLRSVAIGGGNYIIDVDDHVFTQNLKVINNITASEISASTNIDTGTYQINGKRLISEDLNSIGIYPDISTKYLSIGSDKGILLTSDVTGSTARTISGSNLIGEATNVYRPVFTASANPFTASNATAGGYYRAGGNITCSIFVTASVACTTGVEFEFFQTSSTGNVLFETGSGVTLNSKSGNLKLAGQFSGATLKYVGNNEWDLIGDLS